VKNTQQINRTYSNSERNKIMKMQIDANSKRSKRMKFHQKQSTNEYSNSHPKQTGTLEQQRGTICSSVSSSCVEREKPYVTLG